MIRARVRLHFSCMAVICAILAGMFGSTVNAGTDISKLKRSDSWTDFSGFLASARAGGAPMAASPHDWSCRPDVRCDVCTDQGIHTCRIIDCNGNVTDTFTENCVPPDGSSCNSFETCSDCVAHSETCRLIDCHGRIQSTYTQACNGSSGDNGGDGNGGVCTPTSTVCDQQCSPAGTKQCQVMDCNGVPVNTFEQPCTPPSPTYRCTQCTETEYLSCMYNGGQNYGTKYKYSVYETVNGQSQIIDTFTTECGDIDPTPCEQQRSADPRCSR